MSKSKIFVFLGTFLVSFVIYADTLVAANPTLSTPAQSISIAKLDQTQELTNKADDLEQKNILLQSQFDLMKQAILAMSTELNSQNQTILQLQNQIANQNKEKFDYAFLGKYAKYLQYFSGPIPTLILFLLLIIFCFMRVCCCIKNKLKPKPDLKEKKAEICYLGNESDACIDVAGIAAHRDEDYDLMSGAEGIDAKLNLARYYIAKGEMKIAEEMLNEVLLHGNNKQKDEAKELLKTIS